ncbi:NAD-dependent epimerase/dehydratase family protein [Allorhizobium ampelinum]|uniref:NAD-dependent epimerase/dehydratase family protein n=1 Tax=Allorhizobium ampelinum TaxID=3025782 RepID=UPI001F2B71BA|nr:NAD-dependent epimerase/dehydratase family protein [Allorhizobium ampelinum]
MKGHIALAQHVFIIGATGFVGGAVARHFVSRRFRVTGLARSGEAAGRLRAAGMTVQISDLAERLLTVTEFARNADVVMFAAQVPPHVELDAVKALLDALDGSGKTFVFLSGSGVLCQRTQGAWSAESFGEDDPFEPEPLAVARVEAETLVRATSSRGIRGIVMRPPLIWGPEDHGHVSMVYRSVAATGAACYIGDGLAAYSNVHVDDIARLFELAVTKGEGGAVYHAAAGEIPNRWIAEAVARDLGCETRNVSMSEAADIWGEFGALIMSVSSRVRDAQTRKSLGWSPRHTDMLSEIGEPRLRTLATSSTLEGTQQ